MNAPRTERERLCFANKLKAFIVNPEHRYNAKFRTPLPALWTGSCVFTMNDDVFSLAMLPDLIDLAHTHGYRFVDLRARLDALASA